MAIALISAQIAEAARNIDANGRHYCKFGRLDGKGIVFDESLPEEFLQSIKT